MTLYQILDGRIGESYVRCYVWAHTESDARSLFAIRHPHSTLSRCVALFSSDAVPFCTDLSDHGWPDDKLVESCTYRPLHPASNNADE